MDLRIFELSIYLEDAVDDLLLTRGFMSRLRDERYKVHNFEGKITVMRYNRRRDRKRQGGEVVVEAEIEGSTLVGRVHPPPGGSTGEEAIISFEDAIFSFVERTGISSDAFRTYTKREKYHRNP